MSLPVVGKAHEAPADREFRWFVYGSSLSRSAFATWAEQHGYQVPDFTPAVPARLEGYRLTFDVVSRFWNGAVADLTEAEGHRVEGLILPLPGTARGLVDHKEGAISGLYEPFDVKVVPLAGGAPVDAVAYRAAAGHRLPQELPPAPAFLQGLIEGALQAGLSDDYVRGLTSRAG